MDEGFATALGVDFAKARVEYQKLVKDGSDTKDTVAQMSRILTIFQYHSRNCPNFGLAFTRGKKEISGIDEQYRHWLPFKENIEP